MTGSAAAPYSFGGPRVAHGFERVDLMPARKIEEILFAAFAMREIGLEDAADGARHVGGDDVAVKLAAERRVRAKAAADKDVIALDRIGVLVRQHLARQQSDFRNVMLRARVMAAGQMNVDRRVERDAGVAPPCDVLRVALGVGSGTLAAGIAGASDQAGADGVGGNRKAKRLDARRGSGKIFAGDAGEQKILPNREANVAVAQLARNLREPAHLRD